MKKSIIFLLVLGFVLIFILGVRYGQRVEKTNKAVNFMLSLPPTKSPPPTTPPLEFKTYISKDCGISFLYPNIMTVKKETSSSATIKDGKEFISFDCGKTAISEPTVSSQYLVVIKTNPKNSKKIFFILGKSLQPLLEKSLEYLR
jgi:hypothetical protein